MEGVVASLFETSLIGGAFVYLLWYITSTFKDAITKISDNLDKMSDQLGNISTNLQDTNDRLEVVEKHINTPQLTRTEGSGYYGQSR